MGSYPQAAEDAMIIAMRLAFGPDDEKSFVATRELLRERFEAWLVAGHLDSDDPAGIAADAALAMDWKWSFGDGNLARWRTVDITELLLEWCPRKLSASAADCLPIPGAVLAFIQFLEAEGLLARGSSPVTVLAATVAKVADEFVAAMGDSSKFGMAKSILASVGADGANVIDPDAMPGLIAEFNARPEEERHRAISGDVSTDPTGQAATGPAATRPAATRPAATPRSAPTRPQLPPVAQPGDSEVAQSKAAAPILPLFAAFARFVGVGRKLTKTGNLTLADARILVEQLGTGDAMDPKIGDRTFKTVSSAELPRLRQVYAWARKAGVVRVAHGRIIATKRGLSIAAEPAKSFDRAVDALLALGPLSSQRDPGAWLAWPRGNRAVGSSRRAPTDRPLPVTTAAAYR